MPVVVGEVDISGTTATDVVGRVLLDLELMKAQGKRVHEYRFKQLYGQPHHDLDRITIVVGLKSNLTVFNCKVKEVSQIAIPKHVNTPTVFVVSLHGVLDGHILEHRNHDLDQCAVVGEVAKVQTVTGHYELQVGFRRGVKGLDECIGGEEQVDGLLKKGEEGVVFEENLQADGYQVDQRATNVVGFVVPEKNLNEGGDDLSVDFGLAVIGAVGQIHDIFLGLGLRDDAELPILYEFDHVGAIDKEVIVGFGDRVEAFVEITDLVDEVPELLVGLRAPLAPSHDLLCQLQECALHRGIYILIYFTY